ncbi:leucine-rich repeat- and IQ domain-containing protein 1 isoform X1 [Petromyzon marinus]|uniref:leucine-rich repeat- and IQ domain-containing protein 1 isoform X1 n=1 Tax=Petromyzon marinus TaxID=7757 RepID=UPI003F70ADFD
MDYEDLEEAIERELRLINVPLEELEGNDSEEDQAEIACIEPEEEALPDTVLMYMERVKSRAEDAEDIYNKLHEEEPYLNNWAPVSFKSHILLEELAKEYGEDPEVLKKRVLSELEEYERQSCEEASEECDSSLPPAAGKEDISGRETDADVFLNIKGHTSAGTDSIAETAGASEEAKRLVGAGGRAHGQPEHEQHRRARQEQDEQEEMDLQRQRLLQQAKVEEVERENQKSFEAEMRNYEAEIARFQEQIDHEKKELEQRLAKDRQEQLDRQQPAALKIQALFKAYRTRKIYAPLIAARREELRKEKELALRREKEERDRRERLQREEEERKRKEEERRRKEEEEMKQRQAEEKRRLDEAERRRMEYERQKEEERKRLEEERLRIETERLQREEVKRREGERRKLEEEQERQREEEKRKRDDEEEEAANRRKREEVKGKQEEKRRKREERKRKQDEEEERRKREEEERMRADEKEEEIKKLEGEKIKCKNHEPEESISEAEQLESPTQAKRCTPQESAMSIDVKCMDVKEGYRSNREQVMKKGRIIDTTAVLQPCKKDLSITPDEEVTTSEHMDIPQRNIDGKLTVVEHQGEMQSYASSWTLSDAVEARRLAWMKTCKPWSRIVAESRGKDLRKKRPRKNSAAKHLTPLSVEQILKGGLRSSIHQVTTVCLQDLPGCNLSTLAQCPNLQSLRLNRCGLLALDGVNNCKGLRVIDTQDNSIETVNCQDLENLEVLLLSHNHLTSIHGLEGCTNLTLLELSHNNITRIGGLEWQKKLQWLHVDHNQLVSTAGLSELPRLVHLDCSHNQLSSLEGIRDCALLRTVHARGNNLTQIPPLRNQVLLSELYLDDNGISSLQTLGSSWLPHLRILSLSQNGLSDLCPFNMFISLEKLCISNNCVTDLPALLECLAGCLSLHEITLDGNPMQNHSDWRMRIEKVSPALRILDGQTVVSVDKRSQTPPAFSSLCQAQLEEFQHLSQGHMTTALAQLKTMERAPNVVDVISKQLWEASRLAEEHRYAQEYGEMVSLSIEPTVDNVQTENRTSSAKLSPAQSQGTNGEPSSIAMLTQQLSPNLENTCPPKTAGGSITDARLRETGPGFARDEGESGAHSPGAGRNADGSGSQRRETESQKSQQRELSLQVDGRQRQRTAGAVAYGQQRETSEEVCGPVSRQPKASATTRVAVKASHVGNLLGKAKQSTLADFAATAVQAHWRGYHLRRELRRRQAAASLIQASWRARRVRRALAQCALAATVTATTRSRPATLTPPVRTSQREAAATAGQRRQRGATVIQAQWRGFALRRKLHRELQAVRDATVLDSDEFAEVDIDNFTLQEHELDKAWLPAETPPITTRSQLFLSKPPGSAVAREDSSGVAVARQPRQAWRAERENDSHPSGITEASSNNSQHLREGKQEKIREEWGFRDPQTALLMLKRAQKMKSKKAVAQKQMDPTVRLVHFKTEKSRQPPVQPTRPMPAARLGYFSAQEEERLSGRGSPVVDVNEQKIDHVYKWLHTQAGDRGVTNTHFAKGESRFLPDMHPDVLSGGRVQLVASSIGREDRDMELLSVTGSGSSSKAYRAPSAHSHSQSRAGRTRGFRQSSFSTRRNLSADATRDKAWPGVPAQGPMPVPAPGGSAPASRPRQRISFRDAPVQLSGGWGGGRKHGKPV